MRTFKRILLVLLVIFIIAQAFRTGKNTSNDTTKDISKTYVVPQNVKAILAKACNDCHSNSTRYPWYAEIQPVSWWLGNHIKDGKRKLNFNEFDGYPIARQYEKLEDCIKEVKDGGMPLPSYTLIHKDAVLTDVEKKTFLDWCGILRENIKANNPADSLVIKKKTI